MTTERVRVEEFGESNVLDCGWINLVVLWGFFLKILSKNSLHFVGIKVFIVGYEKECEKSKQYALASHSRLGWVASSSCQITKRPVCNLSPIVIQLSCMLHMCDTFWRVTSCELVARSNHELPLDYIHLINFSHSLTYNFYIIPT